MTSARKWRILVVDDEEHVARTLKLALGLRGAYDVRIETKGSRVLATAREFEPDLVVLDLLMPDRRGDDVLRELRADPRLGRVPVLFLTATPPDAAKSDVRPDGWIVKPATAAEIVEHIERRLAAPSADVGGF
jgi:CheY-like chemotaxis protein